MRTKRAKSKFSIFETIVFIFMLYVVIVTLYPFLNVLAISLNDSNDTVKGGIYLWPRAFTLQNYITIFSLCDIVLLFVTSQ